MSSRNAYLAPEDREQALGLYRALESARRSVLDPRATEQQLRAVLGDHGLDIAYAAVRDARTLLDPADRPARALIAARLGKVRLIDNMQLQ